MIKTTELENCLKISLDKTQISHASSSLIRGFNFLLNIYDIQKPVLHMWEVDTFTTFMKKICQGKLHLKILNNYSEWDRKSCQQAIQAILSHPVIQSSCQIDYLNSYRETLNLSLSFCKHFSLYIWVGNVKESETISDSPIFTS